MLSVALAISTGAGWAGDLNQIQRELRQLEDVRQQAERRRTLLMSELRIAEKKIGTVVADLHGLTQQLEIKRDRLRRLRPRFEQQVRAVAREREALGRQLRSAFVMGRQDQLKILLNQQDPLLLNRMMGYYGYISRARIERIASLREKMKELEQIEAEIAVDERILMDLQKRSERERAQLETARQSREDLVKGINQEIRSQEERIESLQQQQERLQELLVRLEQQAEAPAPKPPDPVINNQQATSSGGGKVTGNSGTIHRNSDAPRIATGGSSSPRPRPKVQQGSTRFASARGSIPWPLAGNLAAKFGSQNEAGLDREGVLIDAPPGAEVRAIHSGSVAFAEWMRGFGLLLIVNHGDGYMSLYGHNQAFLKKVGDSVKAGEVIALVGDSGGQQRAQLYFAIRSKGQPVDPIGWCKRPNGRRVG